MLRGVLADGGTASGAAIPGYDMAGKTGTANIAIDGHYSDSAYVASFIGMVPTDHPQLLVAVVVDRAAGIDLRRLGGRARVPEDRRVGCAVPRDPATLAGSRRESGAAAERRPEPAASTASRSSHWPPTSAIQRPPRTAAPA